MAGSVCLLHLSFHSQALNKTSFEGLGELEYMPSRYTPPNDDREQQCLRTTALGGRCNGNQTGAGVIRLLDGRAGGHRCGEGTPSHSLPTGSS